MLRILLMAFRNVGRDRHRAVTTIGAMAFAGALMILYSSLMEGFVYVFERNAVSMNTGDIQIHVAGYRDDPDLYKRVENVKDLLDRLNAAGFNAAPRLYGFGLAAAGSSSSGVTLRGVDTERELKVTQLDRHMMEGAWLDERDPKGVVIGRKLARSLGIGVGSEVVILGQAADGSMANDLYKVRGVLKSVAEGIDRAGFLMLAKSFRELMAVPDGAHEIAVLRRDRSESIQDATRRVAEIAKGYETKNWRELNPIAARMLDVTDGSLFIMLLITYTAIGMVTLNAMLMSVFERIREFGVMKAIGLTPAQVVSLVFAEAMVQAAMACAIALATGLPLSLYFESHGIDLSRVAGASTLATIGGIAFDPVWNTRVTLESTFLPLAALAAVVFLAVIYPGVKAAVIQPVKAIHHI